MEIVKKLDNLIYDKPSVIAIGKFDGLHLGHIKLINEALEIANSNNYSLIVLSINNNDSVILTDEEKIDFLSKFNIDLLILSPLNNGLKNISKEDFLKNILLRNLNMKSIVIGKDFLFGQNASGDYSYLIDNENLGYKTHIVDYKLYDNNKISSSIIRDNIINGNIKLANKMLGYNFYYSGSIVGGNQIGTKIGYPTINIFPNKNKILPPYGVYVGYINGHKGILNIGIKPTINDNNSPNIEFHILDNDRNFDHYNIKIELLDFVRKEIKFDSLDDLQNQISIDIDKVKSFWNEGV